MNEYDLLSLAFEKSDSGILYVAEMIATIRGTRNDTFNSLKQCTFECIARDTKEYERNLYKAFENNIESLFDSKAKIIKKKIDASHRPDFWIDVDGEEIPVEIKLHRFNSTALKQLRRYMEFYKSKKGVAIGKELTVSLPENIIFIPTSAFYIKRSFIGKVEVDTDLLKEIEFGSYCRDAGEPRYFKDLTLEENIALNLFRNGLIQSQGVEEIYTKTKRAFELIELLEVAYAEYLVS